MTTAAATEKVARDELGRPRSQRAPSAGIIRSSSFEAATDNDFIRRRRRVCASPNLVRRPIVCGAELRASFRPAAAGQQHSNASHFLRRSSSRTGQDDHGAERSNGQRASLELYGSASVSICLLGQIKLNDPDAGPLCPACRRLGGTVNNAADLCAPLTSTAVVRRRRANKQRRLMTATRRRNDRANRTGRLRDVLTLARSICEASGRILNSVRTATGRDENGRRQPARTYFVASPRPLARADGRGDLGEHVAHGREMSLALPVGGGGV